MKKFSYSLQKILDLRVFEQKQAEEELGKVNAEIAKLQNQIDDIAKKKVASQMISNQNADLDTYRATYSYIVFLDQRKEEYLESMAKLQLEADAKRKIVYEAMQNVKVLEKLKAKKLEAWKKESLKEEEIVQDDIVSARNAKATSSF